MRVFAFDIFFFGTAIVVPVQSGEGLVNRAHHPHPRQVHTGAIA